jgi:predicted DNA-binding ribbon-helix-helix protein
MATYSSMNRGPVEPDAPARRSEYRSASEARRWASTLINRNVTVAGRRTSMRLEPTMWDALRQVCDREKKNLNRLVTDIDGQRAESSLTAAIRVYLLRYFTVAATDEGHRLAGHGARPQGSPIATG